MLRRFSCRLSIFIFIFRHIVSVADSAGRVSIFALRSGARLAGPFALPANVSMLESNEWRCLAVLTTGALRLWDTKPPGAPTCLIAVDELPLLRDNERIRRCFISECGAPVVVSSLCHSFMYSTKLQTWYATKIL